MTRIEALQQILSRMPEDRKEAFVSELRKAETRDECLEIIKKFGVELTEEEMAAQKKEAGSAVSDEELESAAGGCCNSNCKCNCSTHCSTLVS